MTLTPPPEQGPRLPAYGHGTLAELLPSVLAVLTGSSGDALGLQGVLSETRSICVLLADGLGRDLLGQHRDVAPALAGLRTAPGSRNLDTCFPSTTVTSLASLGTGTPAGRHGLVGYTAWMREVGAVVNLIQFNRYGEAKPNTLVRRLVPESVQPNRTVFQQAHAAGVPATTVSDRRFANSGLTRAALRGPRYVGWDTPDEIPALVAAVLAEAGPSLVYAYDPRLDHAAHGVGVGGDAALAALAAVDTVVAQLHDALPSDAALLVTGDHGMVDVVDGRIDIDDEDDLGAGVRALGGEPRMRHVYAEPGASGDVLDAWRERLGDVAWVRSGKDAVADGWFGPHTGPEARGRVGDVVAAYHGDGGVFCRRIDPRQAELIGHHGSLTEAEAIVPLLVARR